MEYNAYQWLVWAREIQALSQSGIAYTRDAFDRQRYQRLMEIAAEIVAGHSDMGQQSLLENFSCQKGYATPKIDVRGAIISEGQILLVKDFMDGHWCLPGGWADVGVSPAAMVTREVREESGLEVLPQKIIGIYDNNRPGMMLEFYHAYKVIFMCKIVGGSLQTSLETPEIGYFAFNHLPPFSVTRTNERHIADVLAHYQDSSLPTIFD